MKLHIVVGPTGVGKTARATLLAKRLRAPVVVIDRFQVFPELAMGTGRPSLMETAGTVRLYLDERRVSSGELSAHEAYDKLVPMLVALSRVHDTIILEGGSISLWALIKERRLFDNAGTRLEILWADSEGRYRANLRERVQAMLSPYASPASMLVELARVCRQPAQRAFLRTVAGYDALMGYCEGRGIDPLALAAEPLDPALVMAVVEAHVRYARAQHVAFERVFAAGQPRATEEAHLWRV
jgi:adenylate dimethylallyltransferase